jgi:hypothetical protein
MRKLTRLQSIIAGGAFAVTGILGAPAAAMAADNQPPVVTNSVATAADSKAQAAPSAPSDQDLHPVAVAAAQTTFTPDHDQLANAKAIVDAGKAMNLPPRAWEIAVATSLQESKLHNLGNLGASNDHDSLGLFQQRPSSGWGTAAQIQDPTYSATSFYQGLVKVPGWDSLPLTVAAQKVQVSGVPDGYAKHEAQAGDIIDALYGTGPYANLAADLR